MPTTNAMETADFLSRWEAFTNASRYAQDWCDTASTLGASLQGDPNYNVLLTADDQASVQAAVSASSALLQAIPIAVVAPIGRDVLPPVNPQEVTP